MDMQMITPPVIHSTGSTVTEGTIAIDECLSTHTICSEKMILKVKPDVLPHRPPEKKKVVLPQKSSSTENSYAATKFLSWLLSNITASTASDGKKAHPIAKGVYAELKGAMASDSQKTIDTQTSANTEDTDCGDVWLPSTAEDHNKGVPLLVRIPKYDSYNEADDGKLLKKIMNYANRLPQTSGKFANNHIMVNAERTRRMVPPLTRDRHMDQIARDHALQMSESNKVFHMDGPVALEEQLLKEMKEDRTFFFRVGVNIARGKTIEEIHKFMMANLAERNNIIDKRFSKMGMGTARADNGMLYLCQVFGG
jgi:uncharacterized protein YkwD